MSSVPYERNRRRDEHEGWKPYFHRQLAEIVLKFPNGKDGYGPHSPPKEVLELTEKIIGAIERDDLPRPLIVAGSAGSLQIKWRNTPRELSFFFSPEEAEFLEIDPFGNITDGVLHGTDQARELIDRLLR